MARRTSGDPRPRALRRWEGSRSPRLMNTPTCVGFSDEDFMRVCLSLAAHAASLGEVPVGALVVHHHPLTGERRVIGRGFNLREARGDPTAHAEVEALREASAVVGHWRLEECDLYVTLEPCAMCAGALVNARVKRVIYGSDDPKAGATRSLYQLIDDPRLNHRAQITRGVLAEEGAEALRRFFRKKRKRRKSSARGAQK